MYSQVKKDNNNTLRTPEKFKDLDVALKLILWDKLGLSDIKRNGESIEEHNNLLN